MAIYHCSVQVIGRGEGRSAVAAAAYRSGEKLTSEYDGIEHDFTRKGWIEFSQVFLPENAPREYKDRSVLFNAVEMAEKASDAQLVREFEIALPLEMSKEQQNEVAIQFAKALVSQGMCVDMAIHNPPYTNDRHQPVDIAGNVTKELECMQFINRHAHLLATMRPIDEKGRWQGKTEIEYLCRREEEERGFTATEYKRVKDDGWEKQYRFYDGKKKVWLTAAEGEMRGLERVNRSPKTTPHGRPNEIVAQWNSKEQLRQWRKEWETIVNDKFISMGSDVRIDCRSYAEQGREELPTLHMGPAATAIEKRAERELREGKQEQQVIRSDIGQINERIKEHNLLVRGFLSLYKKGQEIVSRVARKMEEIRARLLGVRYEKELLEEKQFKLFSETASKKDQLSKYAEALQIIDSQISISEANIAQLQEELSAEQIFKGRTKKKLEEEMSTRKKLIDERELLWKVYGFNSPEEITKFQLEVADKEARNAALVEAVADLECEEGQLISEYNKQVDLNSEDDITDIQERMRQESETETKLRKDYSEFSKVRYEQLKHNVDTALGIEKSELKKQRRHHG